jgi:two-component system CheB/CheR fusion protein
LDLVNTVLDLGAIETREFELQHERFEAGPLFDEIINQMHVRAAEKNIALNTDISCLNGRYFHSDKVRMRQIFMNLLSNAIKFTDEGSVHLTARYKPALGPSLQEEVEFQIIDTGIGIPEEKLEMVFNRYEKAYENHQYQGTGLGLTIVKELVEKMGGSIYLESHVGAGTKFTLHLPVNVQEMNGQLGPKTQKLMPNKAASYEDVAMPQVING